MSRHMVFEKADCIGNDFHTLHPPNELFGLTSLEPTIDAPNNKAQALAGPKTSE